MITILYKVFILFILLTSAAFSVDSIIQNSAQESETKVLNKIHGLINESIGFEQMQSNICNLTIMKKRNREEYVDHKIKINAVMQQSIAILEEIKETLSLRCCFSFSFFHLKGYLKDKHKILKELSKKGFDTEVYIPHDERDFKIQHQNYTDRDIVYCNNALRKFDKRFFDTIIEIIRLAYKGLPLESQECYAAQVLYFKEIAQYVTGEKPTIIVDSIVKADDFQKKLDGIELIQQQFMKQTEQSDSSFLYTVNLQEKQKFLIDLHKKSQIQKYSLEEGSKKSKKHKKKKKETNNTGLPLFAELAFEVQYIKEFKEDFQWKPKELLYKTQMPQKRLKKKKNSKEIAQKQVKLSQVERPQISYGPKVLKYIGNDPNNPLYIECQNMMLGVQECYGNGGPQGNILRSSFGDWDFETLHQNAKSQKIGATSAIKSRERGNMPWYHRLYFRIEANKIIFTKIGHI